MIIKKADDKQPQIDALKRLLAVSPSKIQSKIKAEQRMLLAGIKGENESRFHIDSKFQDSKNAYVIHDLRLVHDNQVAQIDHIIINRMLGVFVLETKHLHAGLKVLENGEFEQWHDYKKSYQGMASPLAQNARHIEILKKVFSDVIKMPRRLGIQLIPSFYSRVLINPRARIIRPEKFDTSDVIKADLFFSKYDQDYDNAGVLESISMVSKLVSSETVIELCQQLVALHQPANVNYAAKFGVDDVSESSRDYPKKVEVPSKKVAQAAASYSPHAHVCSHCNSAHVNIEYGKYGYYFKCGDCDGNTGIKVSCGIKDHKERIRKNGLKFYRECAKCNTSALYFENRPTT